MTLSQVLPPEVLSRLVRLKQARRTPELKSRDQLLTVLANKILNSKDKILFANKKDLEALPVNSTSAFKERLILSESRIQAMASALLKIAAMPDPLNEVVTERVLSNGLKTKQVRSPLGALFIIFESRPNVAVDAFALAMKSGNALILKAGKEAQESTSVLYSLFAEALTETGISLDVFWGLSNSERDLVLPLLKQTKYIDVVIPRGGDRLIHFVTENSAIPIIKNDRGLCHVFVDESANLEMALAIVENAKVQRPGVCNAMETLLVHDAVAQRFLPKLYQKLLPHKVKWNGCETTLKILSAHQTEGLLNSARDQNFDQEYLDFEMNCKVVPDAAAAIAHISAHGSHHSEAIVTESQSVAEKFQTEVDAAVVYWNASTRFTDGEALGLGGEIGISTQKLHVRGPVGLRELTSVRWLIEGTGQVRGDGFTG